MECYIYYGIEKIYFPQKNQCFWSRFFILNICFSQPHIQSCLSYRPLNRNACTLYYLIDYRIFNKFECCFTLTIVHKWGGLTFHNAGHILAHGHVNDMRYLGKVHAPAIHRRRLEFKITQVYLSRCQSFIYDVKMHRGR